MTKDGGHQLAGAAAVGNVGMGGAAAVRVGSVGHGISTPRGTGALASPSANLVDGFLVGSEVGRVLYCCEAPPSKRTKNTELIQSRPRYRVPDKRQRKNNKI